MPLIKVYSNLAVSIAAATPTSPAGPYTLGASVVGSTNGIPCKGAKMVVGRIEATDANTWANTNLWLSNQPSRLTASPYWFSPPAGYTARAAGILRADSPGGITFALEAIGGFFWHDFAQIWATAAVGGHTGVKFNAEVYYDADADDVMKAYQQYGLAPFVT